MIRFLASSKMEINGSEIVLESDGTVIDDDNVLKALNSEILMLLEPNQKWFPNGQTCSNNDSLSISNISVGSSTSTITLNSSESELDNSELSGNTDDHNTNTNYDRDRIVDESFWENYEIPWAKFGTDIIDNLEKGMRSKCLLLDVVPLIVSDLRAYRANLPCKVFKMVAKKWFKSSRKRLWT